MSGKGMPEPDRIRAFLREMNTLSRRYGVRVSAPYHEPYIEMVPDEEADGYYDFSEDIKPNIYGHHNVEVRWRMMPESGGNA